MSDKYAFMNSKNLKFENGQWFIDNFDVDKWLSDQFDEITPISDLSEKYGIKRFSANLQKASGFWDKNILMSWMNMYIDACSSALYNYVFTVTQGSEKVKEREAVKASKSFEEKFK